MWPQYVTESTLNCEPWECKANAYWDNAKQKQTKTWEFWRLSQAHTALLQRHRHLKPLCRSPSTKGLWDWLLGDFDSSNHHVFLARFLSLHMPLADVLRDLLELPTVSSSWLASAEELSLLLPKRSHERGFPSEARSISCPGFPLSGMISIYKWDNHNLYNSMML